VCSGLAGYFSIDPLLVRIAFVLLALATGAGVVLYLLLWLLVPEAAEPPRESDALRAGLRSVEADLRRLFGAPPRSTVP
jgi:phage shock protein PspC (stress-responsive transcriptional regulator)